MRRHYFFIFICLLLLAAPAARAYNLPGQPSGFVNDYAGILSAAQESALENKLTEFSAASSNEIAVVAIKSLDGDTIENFAEKLFLDWQIGKAKKDNGLLLLVALDDRKMRIEVGYGLEGAMPDATAYQIVTKTLRPAFQAGDYYRGIDEATDQMMAATQGEYQPEAASDADLNFGKLNFELVFFLGFILLNLIAALWRHLAKSRHWWEGGVIGLVLGLLIALIFFRTLVLLIALPLVLSGFGLFFDFLVSRVLPKPKALSARRGHNFWFFGGGPGGFGGGSSGGGFGGFGGGGSGGGGSSGSW
ncbi:MAG: TPM domain-containing protein [Patescibacteria group bacterium]